MKRARQNFAPLIAWIAILTAALGLGLWAAPVATAQDFHVDMQLEPGDIVGLDELAILKIKLESASGRQADAEPSFEVDNFRVAAGPSQASSLRFINGVASRVVTLTWHLQPIELGVARVYSGQLAVEGEILNLPDRQVTVVETAPPRRQRAARQDPFSDPFFQEDPFTPPPEPRRPRRRQRTVTPPKIYLSAEAIPPDPYVGEQVLYTLYLFTQADVRSVNPEQLPDFKGFWTRSIPQPDQLQPEMLFLDGERIGKVVLLQRALFPRRAGRYEIKPIEARMAALLPDSGPFGSLLPQTRQIVRSSNPVTLEVRELPPPPAGYQGAVGQLRIQVDLDPPELEVGQATTLSLTLAGKGHLQGLPPPRLPDMPGLRSFPPQQESAESVERDSIAGERTWNYVLVPERAGRWQLPEIEVPFFDPQQERFRIASAAPLELTVRGTTSSSSADGQTIRLHPIRTAALPAVGTRGTGRLQVWMLVLPWGLAAAVLVARRRQNASRKERNQLLERLSEAAREQRPRQAAAAIEEAWRDFLEQRWNVPRGTPGPKWGALLAREGANTQAADDLVKLADDLRYLRYAPELSSTDDLRHELVERSRKLARKLS